MGRRAAAVAGASFLLSLPFSLSACGPARTAAPVTLRVDFRHPEQGTLSVVLETEVPAGRPLVLSGFVQPEAIGLRSIQAAQGATALPVASGRDERGFGRYTVAAAPRAGVIRIDSVVGPGEAEQPPMSGPTGYRFGHLGPDFAIVTGRQIALLPADPAPPETVRIEIEPAADQDLLTTWARGAADRAVVLSGPDAADRLLRGLVAQGRFEHAESGGFRIHALRSLPEDGRRAALSRALSLASFLTGRLGPPRHPYDLFLVPKAEDGSLIAVTPAPEGMAMSMGDGIPTRWLTIGRAIGRACLESRLSALRPGDPSGPMLEGLPIFLSLEALEDEGSLSRQRRLEGFYHETAGLDLRRPEQAADPIKREWRATVALDRLDRAMDREGAGSLDDLCRRGLGEGRSLYWKGLLERDLPASIAAEVTGWFSPAPRPFPFPGAERDAPALLLRAPAAPGARSGLAADTRRFDLYFGGRNLGLLEQCGCRSRQAGGMARRATLLKRRLRSGRPAMAIELGDAIPFDQNAPLLDRQKEVESDLSLALLAQGGVAASVVGHAELAYGAEFFRRRVERLPRGFRLIAANLRLPGTTLPAFVDAPGAPARVIGLLDDDSYHLGRALEYEDARAGIGLDDPVAALALATGPDASKRLTIVAGSLGPSSVLAIHRAHPEIGMIVTDDYFHFNEDPRIRFERPTRLATFGMLDRTLIVLLQSDSYALVRVGVIRGSHGEVEAADLEELALDESIPDDPAVRARLDRHYAEQARLSGLSEAAPIGGALVARLRADYVGAAACVACHAAESEQWRGTAHASAFATLLDHRRQGVPGCFACHVTGYRQPSGYRAMTDAGLRHVQCEACHGPGGRHLRDPVPGTIVRTPAAAVCAECHTEKHSDMTDENFPDYWARVVHRPVDDARPTR